MAEDGVAWLGEGRFDGVVFEDCGGALLGGTLVSAGVIKNGD